jgi:hypothetical protein
VINLFIKTCFEATLSTLRILATYRAALRAAFKVMAYATDACPDLQWLRYFAIAILVLRTIPGHIVGWAVQVGLRLRRHFWA